MRPDDPRCPLDDYVRVAGPCFLISQTQRSAQAAGSDLAPTAAVAVVTDTVALRGDRAELVPRRRMIDKVTQSAVDLAVRRPRLRARFLAHTRILSDGCAAREAAAAQVEGPGHRGVRTR